MPKAVVQIIHGMAEHRARYDEFARHLAGAGYAVYAEDHRGHGETAGTLTQAGHMADSGGWDLVMNDLRVLTAIAQENHPNLPLFLFGHSMGSILARDYMAQHGNTLAGVVLSGANGNPGAMLRVGLFLSRRQVSRKGARYPSSSLNGLTFGSFNRPFRPAATEFDWLSRDAEEVAAYVADPYCGFVCSAAFFHDLFTGTQRIYRPDQPRKVPAELPLFFISGEKDPVGSFGKGVKRSADKYHSSGVRDVAVRLYPEARHELLHELNRSAVYADVVSWLDSHLPRR